MKAPAISAIVLMALACSASGTRTAPRSIRATSGQESLEAVYDRVHTSVVTIFTVGRTGLLTLEGQAATESGVGSGVLISKEGRILTAAHVVQTADALMVEFADGKRIEAEVVGSSTMADVALIELKEPPPASAKVAAVGDSAQVRIASRAFVVGAPLGISHTLTVGHVSAKRTTKLLGGALDIDVIQTDAAVNKGNSGGPMFNMKGEVIGIVSYIVSQTGGSEGLGFAISSNTARDLLLDRNPVWSGMNFILLAGPWARAFNLPPGYAGMLVQQVAKDSPFDQLGIRGGSIPATVDEKEILLGGDILIEAFGIPLKDQNSLKSILRRVKELTAKDAITMKFMRGGEIIEIAGAADVLMPWLLEGKQQ